MFQWFKQWQNVGLKTSSPIDNTYLHLSHACRLKLKEFKNEKSITLLVVTTHVLLLLQKTRLKVLESKQHITSPGHPLQWSHCLCACETHKQRGGQAHPAPQQVPRLFSYWIWRVHPRTCRIPARVWGWAGGATWGWRQHTWRSWTCRTWAPGPRCSLRSTAGCCSPGSPGDSHKEWWPLLHRGEVTAFSFKIIHRSHMSYLAIKIAPKVVHWLPPRFSSIRFWSSGCCALSLTMPSVQQSVQDPRSKIPNLSANCLSLGS